jgi:hypothetical protein
VPEAKNGNQKERSSNRFSSVAVFSATLALHRRRPQADVDDRAAALASLIGGGLS